MVGENFLIYAVQITGKCICESKTYIYSFTLMPPSKTLPLGLIIRPQGLKPGVVACTCNPATLEAKFRNGVASIPVGSNSPWICGWIV